MIAFVENMHLFTLLEKLYGIMVKRYFTIYNGLFLTLWNRSHTMQIGLFCLPLFK